MIEIDKLQKIDLYDISKIHHNFVMDQFLEFFKMTNEGCFESFREWVSWDDEKRSKKIMPAIEVYKLVTEKNIPKEDIDAILEKSGHVVSWDGFNSHMQKHKDTTIFRR